MTVRSNFCGDGEKRRSHESAGLLKLIKPLKVSLILKIDSDLPSSTHVVKFMIGEIKKQSVVGKNGKIEIQAPDLPEGTLVEVIVLVESQTTDETDYLLSTPANRDRLLQSLEQAKNPDNLIIMTPDEWHEKYCI
jgi:antitoxin YefM